MDAASITKTIEEFVRISPENSLQNEANEAAWEEVLVGFSSGSDPIFLEFKEHIGAFHYTPEEVFNLTFAHSPATSDEITVISWILPQREITKADNRAEDFYPSERWVRARFPGEDFNVLLRKHLVEELKKEIENELSISFFAF